MQRGESRVVEQVLTELVPNVRGLTARILGPDPAVDDVVQEALIEIASALRRFEGRSSLRTYAGRIVVRTVYKHLRKRARERIFQWGVPESADPRQPTPEAACMDRENLRSVYALLDQLPTKHRVAFVLCEVEGMTPTEAAKLTRIPPITLRSHLRRARKKLSCALAADPPIAKRFRRGRS